MSPVPPMTTKKKGQPNNAPEYDENTRTKILRFLAAALTEAELTLEQTRRTAGDDRNMPIFANKIRYHEHQVSTIKWLVYRAYCRQRHLLEMDDETVTEILTRCETQSQT